MTDVKRRVAVLLVLVAILGLAINTFVVSRESRAAEPFGAGQILEIDGPDLNVRDSGPKSDRAIVLLHGFTASIEWWDAIFSALAEPGRRVIAIDLVGHGGSEAPAEATAYNADGQANAITNALDALGVEHAVLIGHSMGGHVATAIAEAKPALVDKVAVIDTFGDHDLRALPLLAKIGCMPVAGEFTDRFKRWDLAVRGSLAAGFAEGYEIPQLAYRSLAQMTFTGRCESTVGDELNAQAPVAQRLADLDKPVLVIWGDRDVLTPTAPNIESYERAGLTPRVIAGSGHTPMVEKPAETLAALEAFLR